MRHRRIALPSALILFAGLSSSCGDDSTSADGGSGGTTGDATDPGTTGGDSTGPAMVGDPPPTPQIVSPADGDVDVGTANGDFASVELCWSEVEDPEGNRVRYRVWLDSIELTEGKLAEEPGFEGPCLGPLDMLYETEHSWQVQAFEADFLDENGTPTSQSGLSELASFTTIPNMNFDVVFEEDFEDGDGGWNVGGDANDGNWVYGDPDPAENLGFTSQPDDCGSGTGCWFTGFNPGGEPNIADVRGGSTTLTSPPFDLTGYETATIQVNRFFYKEHFPETGTVFRVEMLVPDAAAPNGVAVHVLEQLESQAEAGTANIWTPSEYVACGLPMGPDTRLRIVATDLGTGILEAAVDDVTVKGYHTTQICDGGAGSVCDPNATMPCTDGMVCCSQGTFNKGVFRCEQPVPQLSYPDGNASWAGCNAPDLFPTEQGIDVQIDTQFVADNSCLLFEQCVDGPGMRTLMRFNTITPNAGADDLVMGVPSNAPDLFHFSECHQHYHFDGYAVYDLIDDMGNVVAQGHKQAFCLIDLQQWEPSHPGPNYNCGNQGISAGWADIYSGNLDCNWIDITDTPPGDYTLRISVNPPLASTGVPPVVESDYSNNVLLYPVTVP